MCGIIGYIGSRKATPILVEGLHRLEYRGYDSAGVAVVNRGKMRVRKSAGRVADLAESLGTPSASTVGIGHTRWATHGEPSEVNAHPHTDASKRIAVVHNGILENADRIRRRLADNGVDLVSDTDTEVLAHLVAEAFRNGTASLEQAVRQALSQVTGAYGIVVLDAKNPHQLVVARNGSPIVLGVGDGEMFVASDVAALVTHTQRVLFLDDGEVATVTAAGLESSLAKRPTTVSISDGDYDRGDHDSFMHKEIAEQPEAIRRALVGRLDKRFATAHLGGVNIDARELRSVRRVKFLGCGSAYYAGQLGATFVEQWARIPADAEPASEFRYRNPVVESDTLYVAVSQSGETADTLAAVQELRRKGGRVIGIVNVVGSAVARECGSGVFLHAGPEISVASTKAVTNMAVCSALLALLLGRIRDLSVAEGERIVDALDGLPQLVEQVLAMDDRIAAVATRFNGADRMFYIGRVRCWPAAREGAQKLKEISYVHAEAYQASELKHGPLALVDAGMPSVVLVPDDELLAKNIATIEQIKARGGAVIAVTSADVPDGLSDVVLQLPRAEVELEPVLFGIVLQLFAYHMAASLGRDIDRPRNLAKSVTVE